MWWIIFIIWIVLSWWPARSILAKIFNLNNAVINFLALFLPIFVLGPLANIFTTWLKLNDWTIGLSFALSLASLFLIDKFLIKNDEALVTVNNYDEDFFTFPVWLGAIFGLLLVLGFYFIATAVSGGHLLSPWDVLSFWQILIVAVLTAIIIFATYCRKIPIAVSLLMIIALSLLIHSYLLVYKNGFGGDRFRHLGSEERLIEGLEYQPTLLAKDIWYKSLGPIKYPQALTDSAKLSYGTMWSLEVIAEKVSGISVFQINRFLLPILWSIFLTVIMFALAFLLKGDKKFALFSALLANSFYLFQYYGAQGLPASYGLLWLAFYALFLIAYIKNPTKPKFWLLVLGLLLMYFNYSLAFILAGIGFFLAVVLAEKRIFAYPVAVLSVVGLIGLDYLSSPLVAFSNSKLLGAWVFGNLVNFQALNRLAPFIGEWHRIDFLLMAGLAIILVVSLFKIWRDKDSAWLFVALMAKITLATYFFGYLFLSGEHSVVRRLTLFVMLFLVLILADVAVKMIREQKSFVIVGSIIVILTGLTYYSGPVLDVVVGDREVEKAQAIWHDIKNREGYCVKDDLNVILALEYVSAKEFQEGINANNCKNLTR